MFESTRLLDQQEFSGLGSEGRSRTLGDTTSRTVFVRRWAVLGMFCLLTFSNAYLWIVFAPSSALLKIYLNVDDTQINLLSNIFMFAYPLTFLLAIFIYERKEGLRIALVTSAFLHALGACIRWIGFMQNVRSFPLVCIGTVFPAVAQVLILGAPIKLVVVWFPPEERTASLSAALAFNSLGVASGFLLSTAVKQADHVEPYFLYQFIACLFMAICSIWAIRSAPPSPPSRSTFLSSRRNEPDDVEIHLKAAVIRTLRTFKNLTKYRSFYSLTLSTATSASILFTFSTVFREILGPVFHRDVGFLGFFFILLGFGSMLVSGWLMTISLHYKAFYRGTQLLALVALAATHLYLQFVSTPDYSIVGLCVIMYGVASNSLMAIGYQYAAELFYPEEETFITTWINLISCFISIPLILLMSILDRHSSGAQGYTTDRSMLLLIGMQACSTTTAFFVHGRLKRHEYDQDVSVNNDGSDLSDSLFFDKV